ncbi:MAG: hypothetical protein ACR2J8_02285 [Thermomicrobiales bacterium]
MQELFQTQRASILATGEAIGKTIDGRLPDDNYATEPGPDGMRRLVTKSGSHAVGQQQPGFSLVIKHTNQGVFGLGDMPPELPAFGIVRNPLSTLISWMQTDHGVRTQGRAGAIDKMVPEIGRDLKTIEDVLDRQVALIHRVFAEVGTFLMPEDVIRYEEIIESGGAALSKIVPEAAGLNVRLESRNLNPVYEPKEMLRVGERLLKSDGAAWAFYKKEDVDALLDDAAFFLGFSRSKRAG